MTHPKEDPDKWPSRISNGGSFNGQTKWVVRIVSAGVVAALSWFVVYDRTNVDRRFESLERRLDAVEKIAIETSTAQRIHEATGWEAVLGAATEIRADVKDLKRRK